MKVNISSLLNDSKFSGRRIEILRKCFAMISSSGVDGVNLDQAAKKAGLTRPHLLYYFKSKKELIAGSILVATHDVAMDFADFFENSRSKDGYEKFAHAAVSIADKNPALARLLGLIFLAPYSDKDLQKICLEMRSSLAASLLNLINENDKKRSKAETNGMRDSLPVVVARMVDLTVSSSPSSVKAYAEETVKLVKAMI